MKKKPFLGLALAVFYLFGCSAMDKESGEVPCAFCEDENRANTNYGYCFYDNKCIYMSQYDCYDSYLGSFYTSQSSCQANIKLYRSSSSSSEDSPFGSYGYCLYNNQCSYMSQYDCYNYYGSNFYWNYEDCKYYLNDYYGYCLYGNTCYNWTQSQCNSNNGYFYSNSSACQSARSSSSSSYPSSSSLYSSSSIACIGTNWPEKLYDSRNNKHYNTVRICNQVWMAQNLNYDVSGSRCYGDDTGSDTQGYCDTYGRLYDWSTAMALDVSCNSSSNCTIQSSHQGICPDGWHIPTNGEWAMLESNVGGFSIAGRKLKAQSGWSSCGLEGSGNSYVCEDAYNFEALPGGYGYSGGYFYEAGTSGIWWGASEITASNADSRYMNYSNEDVGTFSNDKALLFSVRCLQDLL